MKFLVISCSLRPGSRSKVLALESVKAIGDQGREAEFLDLVDFPLPLCDGDESYNHPHVATLSKKIEEADGILMAVPIYNYYANAAAKNLIELTGRAWEGKLVGFLCAAGGQGSYMSVMGLAQQLMLDFRCVIIPRFLYATGGAFEEEALSDPKVKARLLSLNLTLVRMAEALAPLRNSL